ncbi:hypothetical protein AB0K60_03730 [Thermopolyspora sp. NPDC052614]|uniref:hypothetical protein n=1 Tax=Thermopolyspora sp. NPDC052614 TaxID=3155682 RepID=UPI0034124FF9
MAMPKKGSRLFTLDGVVYRWRVRPNPTHSPGGRLEMTFLVERAEDPRAVLLVNLPYAWRDEHMGEQIVAVRPALVRACLRRALAAGWEPDKSGASFTLHIKQVELSGIMGETLASSTPVRWQRSGAQV